jgi:hypothetical protein
LSTWVVPGDGAIHRRHRSPEGVDWLRTTTAGALQAFRSPSLGGSNLEQPTVSAQFVFGHKRAPGWTAFELVIQS